MGSGSSIQIPQGSVGGLGEVVRGIGKVLEISRPTPESAADNPAAAKKVTEVLRLLSQAQHLLVQQAHQLQQQKAQVETLQKKLDVATTALAKPPGSQGKAYVLTFGKHKGRSLSMVHEMDPSYLEWAERNVAKPQFKEALTQLREKDRLTNH